MKLFDQTMNVLESSLSYSARRNDLITNNIANVDTPNFKTKDVAFKNLLDDARHELKAKRTTVKHMPFTSDNSPFKTITNRSTQYNHNENNVDIDKEMANLAKNQIYYRSIVDRMNGKFNTLQTVIRGGR